MQTVTIVCYDSWYHLGPLWLLLWLTQHTPWPLVSTRRVNQLTHPFHPPHPLPPTFPLIHSPHDVTGLFPNYLISHNYYNVTSYSNYISEGSVSHINGVWSSFLELQLVCRQNIRIRSTCTSAHTQRILIKIAMF